MTRRRNGETTTRMLSESATCNPPSQNNIDLSGINPLSAHMRQSWLLNCVYVMFGGSGAD